MSNVPPVLSAYDIRHYAVSLSADTAEAQARQIALHVERGDFDYADAQRVAGAADYFRRWGVA